MYQVQCKLDGFYVHRKKQLEQDGVLYAQLVRLRFLENIYSYPKFFGKLEHETKHPNESSAVTEWAKRH